jgi:hypothetical protein
MKPDLPSKCPACGAHNAVGADRCSNCGERLRITTSGVENIQGPPSNAPVGDDVAAASSALDDDNSSPRTGDGEHSSTAGPRTSGVVTLRGTVNRFQSRPSGELEVWTFRLETEASNARKSNILVQAGPGSMRGSLHDGESIRVTGKFKEGVLQARRLFSEDHRANVGPVGAPSRLALGVIALFVLALLAVAASSWSFWQQRQNAEADFDRRIEEQRRRHKEREMELQNNFDREVERVLQEQVLTREQQDAEIERRRQEFERLKQQGEETLDRDIQRLLEQR